MKNCWYQKYLSVYGKSYKDIPLSVVQTIKKNIARVQSDTPLVTVSVIAYNEEKHLLACLWSLSDMLCRYPVEIVVVDNNSTDLTSKILKDLNVKQFCELKKGPGHARNCGLNCAQGKYFLCADGDSLYPPLYIDTMVRELEKNNTVGVYGLWKFIPDKGYPRWQLSIYESLRNVYLLLQSIKRPELCVRGMSFGFQTDLGRKIHFRNDIIRGEDGSMALFLKKYGKLKFVRNKYSQIYTGLGTLKNDGSFFNSFKVRVIKAIKGIGRLFTRKEHYEDKEDNLIRK